MRIKEVSKALGVHPNYAYELVRSGQIKATKHNGWNWNIKREDLIDYIENRSR